MMQKWNFQLRGFFFLAFLFTLTIGCGGSTDTPNSKQDITLPDDNSDGNDNGNDNSGEDSGDNQEQAVDISCGPTSLGWTDPTDYMTWSLQIPREKHTYQIGDPEMSFDTSKIDPLYKDQMEKWMTAGRIGGIPHIETLIPDKILEAGTTSIDINRAIAALEKTGGVIMLKDGIHPINGTINLKSNVIIIGESRKGTCCLIGSNMYQKSAFFFDSIKNAGMYRMTIKGDYESKFGGHSPHYLWNVSDQVGNDELNLEANDKEGMSTVRFYHSQNCWLDDMNILNSADFAINCFGKHTTLRNLHIEGSYTKCGGGRGYFYIGYPYNLITGCEVTHLRHISIQSVSSEYNVLINNALKQEVSFHTKDNGNNLIMGNNITLPTDMPGTDLPNYYAIMGPWSIIHILSYHPNFIYKNHCLEQNKGHNNAKPWSDDSKLYKGPKSIKPANPWINFLPVSDEETPIHDTLYPVILD